LKMTDKRTHIIETAIKLFAEKGFHSTSIQEIADAVGIAKGSMYLYFKSKDDLLLSIYRYYQMVFDDIFNAGHEGLSQRERLTAQVRAQLEKFIEFRDFIKMQMREQYIHQNEEVKKAALQLRLRGLNWLYDQILDIYGERIRPWALDCTNMFQSMLGGYMGTMIVYKVTYNMQELADFLVDRLDDLAEGLMSKAPKPILDDREWKAFMACHPFDDEIRPDPLKVLFRQLREASEALTHNDGLAEDVMASLQVLEEELQKEKPKRVIVQGMLSYLLQVGQPPLKKLVKQLQTAAAAVMEKTNEGQGTADS
jgi:AcrR family transcriptional regulator